MEKLREKIRNEIKEKLTDGIIYLDYELKKLKNFKNHLSNPKSFKVKVRKDYLTVKFDFLDSYWDKYFSVIWSYFPSDRKLSLKIGYEYLDLFFTLFEVYLEILGEVINELEKNIKKMKKIFYKKFFRITL